MIKVEKRKKTLFGLPSDVRFCRKCVISNQRPSSSVEFKHVISSKKSGISFDDDGVCDACRFAVRKKSVDWGEREQELIDLCNRFRSKDGSYDCIVPGSGGKDSFFQSHILKTKYNMHPLTVTWAPHLYTDWGWRNFQKWLGSGFDNYLMTPNPKVHRLLTRLAVDNILHPFQPFILGQKGFAPKIASLLNIPLIFYGENEAEYGNPIMDNDAATRESRYYSSNNDAEIFLSGVSVKELKDRYKLNKGDLAQYWPVDPSVLSDQKIEVHYLGYYLSWHPQGAYYYSVENGGFEAAPERSPGTYSKYNSIDDKIDDFHYFTTFIKFGIGRASYDAAQEIRNDEITREEGVALVKKFDGEYPERFAEEIYSYLSITEDEFPEQSGEFLSPKIDRDYFLSLCDSFRSPHLWTKEGNKWRLNHAIWYE